MLAHGLHEFVNFRSMLIALLSFKKKCSKGLRLKRTRVLYNENVSKGSCRSESKIKIKTKRFYCCYLD